MTALAGFRVDGDTSTPAPRRKGAKAEWAPLAADRLGRGVVLAFDQSLRNTAWVLLCASPDLCLVLAAGMCRTKAGDGPTNWPATFADTVSVSVQARAVIADCRRNYRGCVVAHEAPPVGGGQIRRPESSILASAAVWLACESVGVEPVVLANQSAKHLLTGRRRKVTKADVGRAVRALDWLGGRELLTNEDKRDAAAIGLTCLEQIGRSA